MMDVIYPVGLGYDGGGPLARFLPPMEVGAGAEMLTRLPEDDRLVVDPFGTSPRMVVEAAGSNRRLVVACNNPVTRFVLEHTLSPIPMTTFQAALAHLAAVPKNGGRLEPFLLDLYKTQCQHCGAETSAEHFIWDRETNQPILKGYACPSCNFAGESEVDEQDIERAAVHARRGLPHAQALEQVAPTGDPDRPHAEAALAVYPGRALYALMLVLNKLDQLDLKPDELQALQALLLSAMDASNALWGHPEGRRRPKQLTASPQFREINVWRAMERAVEEWIDNAAPISAIAWDPEQPPLPGQVAIFAGTARELAETLKGSAIGALLTVIPRPNQAYWTLSALWAAWLWGHEAAQPIKATLRRRRYDWNWHAAALATVLEAVSDHLTPGTRVLTMVPEAEPGFFSAVLSAFDRANFEFLGAALRPDLQRAFMRWIYAPITTRERADAAIEPAILEALADLGEPSLYPPLHLEAAGEQAVRRALRTVWMDNQEPPVAWVADRVDKSLSDKNLFMRYGGGVEPETGRYWLVDESMAGQAAIDRLEETVLKLLRQRRGWRWQDLDRQVCVQLTRRLTPERRSVAAVLSSYAWLDEAAGMYQLREEDQTEARQRDLEEMKSLLVEIGKRLGFEVRTGETLQWVSPEGNVERRFVVQETASFEPLFNMDGDGPLTLVLPGGRSNLVTYKAKRDERVARLMDEGQHLIKFRHVRRLASETTLTRETLAERLAIDPVAQNDPQLPLL
jgi:hypothetical protein